MKRRTPIRLNALTVALMTRELLAGPCTLAELHEICGLGRSALNRYIKAMRSMDILPVAQWEQDALGRFMVPAYAIGSGKDVKRPKPERARKRQYRTGRDAQKVMNQMLAGKLEHAQA